MKLYIVMPNLGINQVFETMKFNKNEDAVSPVIGVILMVAITVILAAVIAAFVFGMAGNISKTKVVAATATRTSPSNVSVTYQGGQDANTVIGIVWTVDGTAPTSGGTQGSTTGANILPVGSTTSFTASNPGNNVIVGVAYFTDGTQQVIFNQKI